MTYNIKVIICSIPNNRRLFFLPYDMIHYSMMMYYHTSACTISLHWNIMYSLVHNSIFVYYHLRPAVRTAHFQGFSILENRVFWLFHFSFYHPISPRGKSKTFLERSFQKDIPFQKGVQDLHFPVRSARRRWWKHVLSYGFIRYSAYRATPSRNSGKHNAFWSF